MAALASLPLRSPDDSFFNTGSVVIGCLLAGLASGFLWHSLASFRARQVTFVACAIAVFVIVAAVSFAMDAMPEAPIEHIPGFVVPLAAVLLASLATLQPYFFKVSRQRIPAAVGATVVALTVGVALAGQGDGQSGTLSLVDLPTAVPSATATRTPVPTATAQVVVPLTTATGVLPTPTFTPTPKPTGAYIVSSAESTSTYTVREKLSNFPLPSDAVGHTDATAITGEIYLDGRVSRVGVDLRTFTSDQSRRDSYIRNQGGIQSNRYPYAEFTVTDVGQLSAQLVDGKTVTGKVAGTMKIREVEKPFTFDIEARMVDGGLQLHGVTEFTWADFNIPPPNVRGIVQVEDKVKIEVLIVAKQS